MRRLRKSLAAIICALFCVQTAGAQVLLDRPVMAGVLPAAASFEHFRPQHLRALEINPLTGDFDVVLDRGDSAAISQEQAYQAVQEPMRYFRDALRLPASVFWVNLRPDGENEIIDPLLERSDIGRIMLEADLQLKKDLACMTDPDTTEGREYWDNLYAKAETLFGPQENTEIPALARPWIVPGEILLGVNDRGAYIFKATLKVMLEQDYLHQQAFPNDDPRLKALNEYSAQLIRSRILPALTRKVNASRSYAPLRQVYYSLILAEWYKERFQQGRTDNRGMQGLTSTSPWSKLTYFNAYKKSFLQGEYHKDKTVASAGQLVIRQYASGGLSLGLGERGNLGSLNLGARWGVLREAIKANSEFVQIHFSDMRRYGEAPRQGLSADNFPPKAGASSIRRDDGSRDGGQVLSEAFLLRHPNENSAARAALEQKAKELAALTAHVRFASGTALDLSDEEIAQLGAFADFMLFGPDGPAFARKDSLQDRLEAMISRISALTRIISSGSVNIDAQAGVIIRQHLEQGFKDVVYWKSPDYERFNACFCMAAAVLQAAVNHTVPSISSRPVFLEELTPLNPRGFQVVNLVARMAEEETALEKIGTLADFVNAEHADLYDLAVEAQRWDNAERFLRNLLERRDKRFLDFFAGLDDAEAWLHEDLKAAMRQLLSIAHTNNSYRLKQKALGLILRIAQVEDLSKAIGKEPESYRRIAEAIAAYAANKGAVGGTSANDLLERLRQELIAVARDTLLSEVFISDVRRPDIESLEWVDERTLEQIAFVIGVYAHAKSQKQFSLADWTAKVLKKYLELKDREKLNTWLNSEFSWNKEDRRVLQEHGYSPQLFSQGYARTYALNGRPLRISIDFDFFNQATAGEEVPSCFHPTSAIGGHMPLYHALEVSSTFMSVSDEQGRRIADAVVLLSPDGLIVQKLYTRGTLDLDRQIFDYFAHLINDGMVPAVFWQSESPGLQTALNNGLGKKDERMVEKELRLDQDKVYFDTAYYYSSLQAKFRSDYVLSRQDAAGYRTPEDMGKAVSVIDAPSTSSRRISKPEKSKITRSLFALGLRHVDLGPILQNIEELIFDDPSGSRLNEVSNALKAKDGVSAVSADERAQIRNAVVSIKESFAPASRDASMRDGGSPERIAELLDQLKNGRGVNDRIEAAYALGELRATAAVGPLIKVLRTSNYMEKQVAAAALGMIGDQRAVEPLMEAINDINPPVRRNVYIALAGLEVEEALEQLCVSAREDEYAQDDAIRAITMFLEGSIDFDSALVQLRRLGDSYDLPFETYAWFLETFVFDQPDRLSNVDLSWLADKTGLSAEDMAVLAFIRQGQKLVESLTQEGLPVVYSGDRIWLSMQAARMSAQHQPEYQIEQELDREATNLAQARRFLPSVGTEIEVFASLISDERFDARRARKISSWLGINLDNKDGLIEYAVNPTSHFSQQVEIKDFLLRSGLIPRGVFPIHINEGVSGGKSFAAASRGLISQYIALPLSLLYASDRRFIDTDTDNYFGPIVDVKDVSEGPQDARIELRANLLVNSSEASDYKGVFGTAEEAFASALRASTYLTAVWEAYEKKQFLRSPMEAELAGLFMDYVVAVGQVYARPEHRLVWAYAASLQEYDTLALYSTLEQRYEEADKQKVVKVRQDFPGLQAEIGAVVKRLITEADKVMQEHGALQPVRGIPVPVVTVVRPEDATPILTYILDKAEKVVIDLISLQPGIIEEALQSLGKSFPSGSIIESVELSYHDSGHYKHTFKTTVHSGQETRDLLLVLKTDTKAISGLFEKGELEMWTALQGSALVPQLGPVVSATTTHDSSAAEPLDSSTIAMVEFIDGQNVFKLTGKEMFDYEFGRALPQEGMTAQICRACLATLVDVFLRLNRDFLRETADFDTAHCKGPYDFYQQNIVIEKDTGRAVLVDLGRQREYAGIHDYLALAIAFYLERSEDLSVLSERWPQFDWDTVLARVVQTLEIRKEQYAAHTISHLHMADIIAEEKDINNVIDLIKGFLDRQPEARSDVSSRDGGSKGGIDLRGVAMARHATSRALVLFEAGNLALMLTQLRQEESEGVATCEELKEKLNCLTN